MYKILIIATSIITLSSCVTRSPEDRCRHAQLEIESLEITETYGGGQSSKIKCTKYENLN